MNKEKEIEEAIKETAMEILDKLLVIFPQTHEEFMAFVRAREEEYGVKVS